MSEIVYAVHTRACTYLLDEDGFCRWVLSRSGARSDDRCVGAQFVAALDLRSKGGLVGELRIGAQALFIRHEDGRFALIRTKPIEHVEIRGADSESEGTFDIPSDDASPGGSLPSYSAQGYGAPSHSAQSYGAHQAAYGDEPEADPVVLPDRLAVAAVFNAPAPAPEPEPPSARVILQTPSPYGHHEPAYAHHAPEPAYAHHAPEPVYAHHAPEPPAYAHHAPSAYVAPRTEPPPPVEPPQPKPRAFPQPPPREPARRREERSERPPEPAFPSAAHAFAEAHARPVDRSRDAAHDASPGYRPAARAAFPRAPAAEPARGFPAPPPRAAVRPSRDPSTETQPLPSSPELAPLPPTGRVPAWPAMLAPPPPQAEMMPLGPARPNLPSAEELSVDDLEEVGDDDQVYSMEVTLTLPLYRGDQSLAAHYFPKRPPK